ncbi:MAG: flippase-like domain-containing protein [Desulfotomaculum sp.]|nr:flippase-like domain-containing protein [Desulfotomaculum sp.]
MSGKKVFLWLLSILVITVIVFFAGWESIKATFLRVNIYWLLALFLLQVATLVIIAYRWHYLIKKLYNKISFRETFNIFLAGSFVESVTPSSKLGGEAVRIYLFRRHTALSYRQLTAILLLDKYFTLLPFALLCTLVLLWSIFSMQLPWQVYLSLPVLVIFVLAILRFYHPEYCRSENINIKEAEKEIPTPNSPKMGLEALIAQKIKDVQAFVDYSARYSRQLVTVGERYRLFLLSLFIWVLYPLKIYLVIYMLDFNVSIISVAMVTYIAYLVSTIPLLPGGLGSFEGAMAFMFTYVGLSFAEGLAIALLARLVTFWFPLCLSAGATAYLTWKCGKITEAQVKY